MKFGIITCATAMLSTLGFACSSSSTSEGGIATNGGAPGGDGSSGGSNSTTSLPYSGYVQISNAVSVAAFGDNVTATSSWLSGCTTTVGDCTVYDCAEPSYDADAAVPPEYSAGDITLSGGSLAPPGSLSFDATKDTYPASTSSKPTVAAGDTIQVSAAGDTVHSFSASVVVPNDVQLTSPVQAADKSFMFDTSSDLDVTWSNGNDGAKLDVSVTPTPSAGRYQLISCIFDAAAGRGTIPASALSHFGPIANGTFGFYPRTVVAADCDNASVNVYAVGTAVGGSLSSK